VHRFIQIAFGALVVSSIALAGCRPATFTNTFTGVTGSGNVETETREINGVTAVELANSGSLEITQGNAESLEIEAEDNILPLLTSDVRDGRLVLGVKPNTSIRATRPIVFRLTVRNLNETAATASGNITALSFEAGDLTLHVNGSGNLSIDTLNARAVKARLTGSGSVTVNGAADTLDVTISGSGSYNGSGLTTRQAVVRSSASGSAHVNVTDDLDATVSGSGSIIYTGNPAVRQTDSGSGSIRPR